MRRGTVSCQGVGKGRQAVVVDQRGVCGVGVGFPPLTAGRAVSHHVDHIFPMRFFPTPFFIRTLLVFLPQISSQEKHNERFRKVKFTGGRPGSQASGKYELSQMRLRFASTLFFLATDSLVRLAPLAVRSVVFFSGVSNRKGE